MYRMMQKRFTHEEGTIVYRAKGHDYGCARDDSYGTGVDHISVTLDKNGDYPFFTIPVNHLETIFE